MFYQFFVRCEKVELRDFRNWNTEFDNLAQFPRAPRVHLASSGPQESEFQMWGALCLLLFSKRFPTQCDCSLFS